MRGESRPNHGVPSTTICGKLSIHAKVCSRSTLHDIVHRAGAGRCTSGIVRSPLYIDL